MTLSWNCLYKTLCSAYLAKGLFLLCKFFTIPLLLLHLPQEDYAVFALLGGMEGWFLLLDFGMGSSLQNAIASKKEEEELLDKTAILYILLLLVLSLLGLYAMQGFLCSFLGGTLGLTQKIRQGFWITVPCFALGSLGSFVSKVLLARQKGHLFYIVQGLSHLLSMAILSGVILREPLSLTLAITILWGIPHLASTLLGIYIFRHISWKVRIRWDLIFKAKNFFLFTLMTAFVSLSDTWIMSHTLSMQQIVEYNVLCKIFGIAAFAYAPVMHSLLPMCSFLFSKKRGSEVTHILHKQCLYWLLGITTFSLCIELCSPTLEGIFSLSLARSSIWAFGIYIALRMVADFYTMALQSHGALSSFFYLIPLQALLSIILQYTLSLYMGVGGLIMGMALSYLCTLCWALPRQVKRLCL